MDQGKIGSFLRRLRKEKNITQEGFAEMMNVSNRSVSRWETGSNMPDLELLILIADYYDVEISEILDGERKTEQMKNEKENVELEETVLKVAEYSKDERDRLTKRMHGLFLVGVAAFMIYLGLEVMGLADQGYTEAIASFAQGVSFGMLLLGVIYTSQLLPSVRNFKQRVMTRK